MPGTAFRARGNNGLSGLRGSSARRASGSPAKPSAAPGLGMGWAWAPLAVTARETEVAVTFKPFLCRRSTQL